MQKRDLFRDLVLCRLNPESVELQSPAERQEVGKRRQQRKRAFFLRGSCYRFFSQSKGAEVVALVRSQPSTVSDSRKRQAVCVVEV